MKTVLFQSPAQGTLGESAICQSFARMFVRGNETFEVVEDLADSTVDWRFAFGNISSTETPVAYVVLCVFPTLQGVAWAQRTKNKWVLAGVSLSRMAAVVIFGDESNALPLPVIERALEISTLVFPATLANLFAVHNDDVRRMISWPVGERKSVAALRLNLDRELMSTETEEIVWQSVEKDVLRALWETWSTESAASSLSVPELEQRVRTHIAATLPRHGMSMVDGSLLQQLERRLLDRVVGLGPLEPFLRDREINEIMIVGTACLYVEKNGHMLRVPPPFDHEAHLKTIIERIVAPSGRRVDWAAPFCDVRLKDGSRVNIVLPPLALDGPCVTIRRFRSGFSSMENLEQVETVTAAQARRLEQAVRERRNIIIAGNTGSGKTTLMNVLASFIPDSERILTLEDAAELTLNKSHVVRLETRPANTEGKGEITMRDLVVNALRMRPDRLLVGECRGVEVIPMLQAMNTGHDGSMTTLHANSADEVATRLESLVSMAAPSWSRELIHQQIASAFDLIVYIKRDGPRRRVEEIRDVV